MKRQWKCSAWSVVKRNDARGGCNLLINGRIAYRRGSEFAEGLGKQQRLRAFLPGQDVAPRTMAPEQASSTKLRTMPALYRPIARKPWTYRLPACPSPKLTLPRAAMSPLEPRKLESQADPATTAPECRAPGWPLSNPHDYPPLVFAGEARELRRQFAEVKAWAAFSCKAAIAPKVLPSSPAPKSATPSRCCCRCHRHDLRRRLPGGQSRRMAGQFAKPRSANDETIDGVTLPAYRGDDIVNGIGFDEKTASRTGRLLQSYHQSTASLNLLRALPRGFADLHQVHQWNLDFIANSGPGGKVQHWRAHRRNPGFSCAPAAWTRRRNCAKPASSPPTKRCCSITNKPLCAGQPHGDYYDCSAHMLWIGDRTRSWTAPTSSSCAASKPDRGESRPEHDADDDLIRLIDILNPDNDPGRLNLIVRMGADGRRPPAAPDRAVSVKAARCCGAPIRCTATPSRPAAAAKPATLRRSWRGQAVLRRYTRPKARRRRYPYRDDRAERLANASAARGRSPRTACRIATTPIATTPECRPIAGTGVPDWKPSKSAARSRAAADRTDPPPACMVKTRQQDSL